MLKLSHWPLGFRLAIEILTEWQKFQCLAQICPNIIAIVVKSKMAVVFEATAHDADIYALNCTRENVSFDRYVGQNVWLNQT